MNTDAKTADRRPEPTQLCISALSYSVRAGQVTIPVLNEINLGVTSGEIVAIVGPSGCGKSTLIHLAAGFLKPDRGSVSLDGESVSEPSTRLGVMFQDLGLLPWRTVRGNIQFGIEGGSLSTPALDERVEKLIASVGLSGFADFYPHELSGGMAQRVALARTLAPEPRVLLMDEPFRSLDAQTRLMMQEELLRLWEADRRTIVFVTHDVDEAVFLATRIIVLTARPATVREVFDVPLPRPRTAATRYRPEYTTIRNHVLSSVSEESEVANWLNEHAAKRPSDEYWIGYVDSLAEAFPLLVAEQKGFFKDQHLKVGLWCFRSGVKIASLVADGYLHAGSLGPIALLSALDKGGDFSRTAISSNLAANGNPYVALCVKSGSELRTVAELTGKRVAVNGFQTTGYDLVRQAASDADVFASIEIVPLPLTEMVPALEQGAVDAALLSEPYLGSAVAAGRISVLADMGKSLAQSCLSVMLFGREHNEKARQRTLRAQAAIMTAVRLIDEDPVAARQLLASASGVPEATLKSISFPSWRDRADFVALASLVKPLAARGVLAHPQDVARRLSALEERGTGHE